MGISEAVSLFFFPPSQGDRFEFTAAEDDVIYDDVPCENLDANQDGRNSPSSLDLLLVRAVHPFHRWAN